MQKCRDIMWTKRLPTHRLSVLITEPDYLVKIIMAKSNRKSFTVSEYKYKTPKNVFMITVSSSMPYSARSWKRRCANALQLCSQAAPRL